MCRGPSFIVSTMQEETTPIFKRLWYDWTQQQPGIEPTNPLGHRWVPPIVAFYDQQGLLRTYLLPGSSIRSPHPGSPFLNVFGMTGPCSNRESNPQILLVSAESPLSSPFTISRGGRESRAGGFYGRPVGY